jgi:hypothetical protein
MQNVMVSNGKMHFVTDIMQIGGLLSVAPAAKANVVWVLRDPLRETRASCRCTLGNYYDFFSATLVCTQCSNNARHRIVAARSALYGDFLVLSDRGIWGSFHDCSQAILRTMYGRFAPAPMKIMLLSEGLEETGDLLVYS